LLIAPCGMNCSTCLAYLRDKNQCKGCRIDSDYKSKHCDTCSIMNCGYLTKTDSGFCFTCEKFPCTRLKQLDKRYRIKYKTSLLGNLESIKNEGMEAFLQVEYEKWRCPDCGGTICIHRGFCLQCKIKDNSI
jgi:hypothetical protein